MDIRLDKKKSINLKLHNQTREKEEKWKSKKKQRKNKQISSNVKSK